MTVPSPIVSAMSQTIPNAPWYVKTSRVEAMLLHS